MASREEIINELEVTIAVASDLRDHFMNPENSPYKYEQTGPEFDLDPEFQDLVGLARSCQDLWWEQEND